MAGPVTVCAVQWLSNADPEKILKGIKDSKKLNENGRNIWVEMVKSDLENKHIHYHIHSIEAKIIDKIGIMKSLKLASDNVLKNLDDQKKIKYIYSDYGLPISSKFKFTHIIKGDEKNPLISLASIIAKVSRDNYMLSISKNHNKYNFGKNKGYGTKEHRDAIEKYGITKFHRKTFLKNIHY